MRLPQSYPPRPVEQPADLRTGAPGPVPPALLVTIDVESDMPEWRVLPVPSLANLRGLPRFQALCDRLGVRPTYLITYRVATREEGAILRELHADGRCEIGAHLHCWSTPPFAPGEDPLEAVQANRVAPDVAAAKLTSLTEAIGEGFAPPTSFRAGRFGLDGHGLAALERLGYRTDTSVTPGVDWRREGGPDFRHAPGLPYFPNQQDPARVGWSPVLEVPVSIAWDRPVPERWSRAILAAPRALRLRGLLENPLRPLLRRRWLYPSHATAAEMCRAADVLVAAGAPCLNVFFHSNELWPATSPYCRTAADVDAYLRTLEVFFTHVVERHRAVPRTLDEFRAHFVAHRAVRN